jgi:hypothetical protein
MSTMEPIPANQPPASEPVPANATETKAHGNRHFRQVITPGLGGTRPLLPEWLRTRFRRKSTLTSR